MKVLIVLLTGLLLIAGCSSDYTREQLDSLASCLKEKGIKEYGAFWCPNCAKQQKMFGSSYDIIKKRRVYVECDPRGEDPQSQLCLTKNVIKMAVDVTWPVIITTALVDSINPCAIGVLILLISTLLAMSHDKKRMLAVGSIYIAAIYIVYFLAGIGLLRS